MYWVPIAPPATWSVAHIYGRHWSLTIDAFQQLDDLPEGHCLAVLCREVGQDTGTEGDLLVKVALVEAEMAELEFWRNVCAEIGIEDTERVELTVADPPSVSSSSSSSGEKAPFMAGSVEAG